MDCTGIGRVIGHWWRRWRKRPDEMVQWRSCRRCGLLEERDVHRKDPRPPLGRGQYLVPPPTTSGKVLGFPQP
jgi:hypothetical protein